VSAVLPAADGSLKWMLAAPSPGSAKTFCGACGGVTGVAGKAGVTGVECRAGWLWPRSLLAVTVKV
jgi:hypothetical protein